MYNRGYLKGLSTALYMYNNKQGTTAIDIVYIPRRLILRRALVESRVEPRGGRDLIQGIISKSDFSLKRS